MIDSQTRKDLRVLADGTDRPYLKVPVSQLPLVREILDRHQAFY